MCVSHTAGTWKAPLSVLGYPSLFPCRSGIRRVWGSSTTTKPGASPRGEASGQPSASAVERMRNGERPMKARACGSIWSRLFFTAKTLGAPIEARQFGDSFNLSHLFTNPNTLIECVQRISRAEKGRPVPSRGGRPQREKLPLVPPVDLKRPGMAGAVVCALGLRWIYRSAHREWSLIRSAVGDTC